jgi:enoyl-CoA hydratase
MEFTSDVISIERNNATATVWLDRPEKHNAMGRDFWTDLPRAMESVGANDSVRVVVIAGRGPSFTAGLDLREFADLGGSSGASPAAQAKAFLPMVKAMQWTMTAVAECPKPVIAAVHGNCLGGGIDLITAADIRLASADAVFSVRETKIAMVADVGTLQRLPRVIAPGHANELAFTGKDIDAERAATIGLVNDVYADQEQLMKAAYELAREIADNSPLVVQGTKHIMQKSQDVSVAEGLEYVALWNTSFLRSSDLTEAMAAFAEKRPPHYTGE